jgi:hypothetical protein
VWYRLEHAGSARLTLVDLSGAAVARLELGRLDSGEHQAGFGLGHIASGIYLIVLESDEGEGWSKRAEFKLAVVR